MTHSEVMPHDGGPSSPVFIACSARSGSTLLRWLIDSHPDVACPGETDVATLVSAYMQTSAALLGNGADPAHQAGARAMADKLVGTYLDGLGKSHWCDKSLSNVLQLDQLAATWPEAKFILLHRHCMDFVMSGLEASAWGLDTYGFASYAQMSPTNPVIALIGYWIERTTKMLAFEQAFPDRCLRVRYEDLVSGTDEVMAGVWNLFGVPEIENIAKSAFEEEHDPLSPADYKIWFTQRVHTESVGGGARVPPDRAPGAIRASMNELLGLLDYRPVGDDWGRGGMTSADAPTPIAATEAELIELRVLDGHSIAYQEIIDLSTNAWPPAAGASTGLPAPAAKTPCVVVIERGALAGISSGSENFGAALRDRTVRCYGPFVQHFGSEKRILDRLTEYFALKGPELLGATGLLGGADPTLHSPAKSVRLPSS